MITFPFNVRVFEDVNEKLQSLLSQPASEFDSVIFVFNHSLRYKLTKHELGIHNVSDLLFPHGYGTFQKRTGQNYYLYYNCVGFNAGLYRLQEIVHSYSSTYVQGRDLHLFIERSRKKMKLLYFKDNQVIVELRQLKSQKYILTKQERKDKYTSITWKRLNEILSSRE
ncbi:IS66 family insertion sequence element accessory protein TnpB [Parabacteroides pacaensis]|uniref:IS66 family insertion sequence element accessory protein TnpB n=1 Tax=Parabacteroides pacaensis TaxID=2086575 RepID=UPI000D10CA77|nr:IS66 family insertion sequence element accessory protein TnpB [Parabacteroides pacaensis]